LRLERDLPSAERGPVLCCELRRLAAICFSVAINENGAAVRTGPGGCPAKNLLDGTVARAQGRFRG
jgi:hypothetical protein